MRDRRGVVYAETLVAFLPVFTFFAATLQLADLSAAQLVVQHASTTAARAAAVVLPDDGAYYGDRDNQALHQFGGARQGDVEQAADLVLRANTRLDATGANVGLDKSTYAARDDMTATVSARFRCLLPIVCGGDLTLRSESKLVYQGAKFVYDPTTLGDVRPRRPPGGRPPDANDPAPDRPQDPDQRPPDDGDPRPPVADNDPPPRDERPGQSDGTPRDATDGRPRDPSDGKPPAVADNGRPPTDGRPSDGRPNDANNGRQPSTDKPGDGRPHAPSNGRPPAVADNGRPPATDKPSDGRPNDPSNGRPPALADNGHPNTDNRRGDDGKPSGRDFGPPPPPTHASAVPPGAVASNAGLPARGDKDGAPSTPPVSLDKPSDEDSGPLAMADGPPRCVGDACSVGSGQCFAAGTLVHTEHGDRPIESIQVGDRVWSRSQETGEVALRPIARRFVTRDQAVLDLHLAGLRGDEHVMSTPAHRFWVERVGWVNAETLGAAAALWSPEGPVTGSTGEAQPLRVTVYNLEVDDFHTYFVGAVHAWVHNDCEIRKEYAPELKRRQDLAKQLKEADRIAQSDPAEAARIRQEVEQKLKQIREVQAMSDAELEAEARDNPVTSDRNDRANEVQYERYRRQRTAEAAQGKGKGPKTFNAWYNSRNPKREDARARAAFRGQMARTIANDPDHPLRFLLDERGRLRVPPNNNRAHHSLIGGSEDLPEGEDAQRGPATPEELAQRDDAPWYVEAGHRTSQHSGEPEYLGLQDAWQNQYEARDEAKNGAVYDRHFIDIGGVPVELATARAWEAAGLLPAGTTPPPPANEEAAKQPPFTQGWSVSDWNHANPPR